MLQGVVDLIETVFFSYILSDKISKLTGNANGSTSNTKAKSAGDMTRRQVRAIHDMTRRQVCVIHDMIRRQVCAIHDMTINYKGPYPKIDLAQDTDDKKKMHTTQQNVCIIT
jgi:hypothetical protein